MLLIASAILTPFLLLDVPNDERSIRLNALYKRDVKRYSNVYGWEQVNLEYSSIDFGDVCSNNVSSVLENASDYRNYSSWINVSSISEGAIISVGENTTAIIVDQVRIGNYDCWEGYQDNETIVYYVKVWGLFGGRRWNATVGSYWFIEEITLISVNYDELVRSNFTINGLLVSILIVELAVGETMVGLVRRNL